MLFNSYEFILIFLPTTLVIFYLLGGRCHHRIAISWMVVASLFFYSWWNPAYLWLILVSILFNYITGIFLSGSYRSNKKKMVLVFGVLFNLGLISYFKYANFFIDNLNTIFETHYNLGNIILPLAISFFTFQQIAYLIDAYRGETKEYSFLHYCLFVTFFPQLIAGPIVHHKEMLPQFEKDSVYKLNIENLAVGLSIFIIGLFKKVVLADNIALFATPVFNAAENGVVLTIFEAWGGALAYTFQLYFDFSGYCDMAIGIAMMIGVRLPLNFNSPYKAINIIDFWGRWHMTLSRFLKDYLYIPLGGNRKGKIRRYINLLATMLIGGLWHGAGWTFIAWGALHGVYLIINYAWRTIRIIIGQDLEKSTIPGRLIARVVTFVAVILSWVFFRAETFEGALSILKSMSGLNGISLPRMFSSNYEVFALWLAEQGVVFKGMFINELAIWDPDGILYLLILFIIVWFMPNTIQIMKNYHIIIEDNTKQVKHIIFRFNLIWSVIISLMLALSMLYLGQASEFLYFQF